MSFSFIRSNSCYTRGYQVVQMDVICVQQIRGNYELKIITLFVKNSIKTVHFHSSLLNKEIIH